VLSPVQAAREILRVRGPCTMPTTQEHHVARTCRSLDLWGFLSKGWERHMWTGRDRSPSPGHKPGPTDAVLCCAPSDPLHDVPKDGRSAEQARKGRGVPAPPPSAAPSPPTLPPRWPQRQPPVPHLATLPAALETTGDGEPGKHLLRSIRPVPLLRPDRRSRYAQTRSTSNSRMIEIILITNNSFRNWSIRDSDALLYTIKGACLDLLALVIV
jgi:hypothetical protein